MKAIKVSVEPTPLMGNEDCAWSVGVMNLTMAEADLVARYARGVRSVNSPRAMGLTATEMRDAERSILEAEATRPAQQWATWDTIKAETMRRVRDAEIEMMRNEVISQRLANDAYSYERLSFLSGDWKTQPEKTVTVEKPAEPEKPRNRFSGLDLGDE